MCQLGECIVRNHTPARTSSTGWMTMLHDTADTLKNGIAGSELLVFEGCVHAAIYESVAEFNEKTLSFLS
jgi:hypothetical protein